MIAESLSGLLSDEVFSCDDFLNPFPDPRVNGQL